MGIGICITLFGVAGYFQIQKENDKAITPPASVSEKPVPSSKARGSARMNPDLTAKKVFQDRPVDASVKNQLAAVKIPRRGEDETNQQSPVTAVIGTLSQFLGKNRFERFREFRTQLETLKEMGRDAVPELLSILEGDGPEISKIIALSVLGSINADLHDEDLSEILNKQGVPLLDEILKGDAPLGIKRQALFALGEIGTPEAHETLIHVMNNDPNRRIRAASLRILGKKGSVDSAYQLLPLMDNPGDHTQFMMAASAIGMINKRVNDPGLTTDLMEALPSIERIIYDETETMGKKHGALMTLASIGNEDANRTLMDIAAGGEEGDERLQRGAIMALVRTESPEVAVEMGAYLEKTTSEEQQIRFAGAIGAIAGRNPDSQASVVLKSQALPTLHSIAASAQSLDNRTRAIYVIGRVGGAEDIAHLRELGAVNADLRSATTEAINQIQAQAQGHGRLRPGRFLGGMY